MHSGIAFFWQPFAQAWWVCHINLSQTQMIVTLESSRRVLTIKSKQQSECMIFFHPDCVYCLDISIKNTANLFHHNLSPDNHHQPPLQSAFSSQPFSLLIPHIFVCVCVCVRATIKGISFSLALINVSRELAERQTDKDEPFTLEEQSAG